MVVARAPTSWPLASNVRSTLLLASGTGSRRRRRRARTAAAGRRRSPRGSRRATRGARSRRRRAASRTRRRGRRRRCRPRPARVVVVGAARVGRAEARDLYAVARVPQLALEVARDREIAGAARELQARRCGDLAEHDRGRAQHRPRAHALRRADADHQVARPRGLRERDLAAREQARLGALEIDELEAAVATDRQPAARVRELEVLDALGLGERDAALAGHVVDRELAAAAQRDEAAVVADIGVLLEILAGRAPARRRDLLGRPARIRRARPDGDVHVGRARHDGGEPFAVGRAAHPRARRELRERHERRRGRRRIDEREIAARRHRVEARRVVLVVGEREVRTRRAPSGAGAACRRRRR